MRFNGQTKRDTLFLGGGWGMWRGQGWVDDTGAEKNENSSNFERINVENTNKGVI